MTKIEFMAWLERHRYTGWVREAVASMKFSEAELEALYRLMQPKVEIKKSEERRKMSA